EQYDHAKDYSTQKYAVYSEKAKKNYVIAKDYTVKKTNEAKVTYAPQLEYAKIKYDQAKLKVKGYSPPNVDDKSETGMISHFEKRLKFGAVDIDEFERRLKKLVDVQS
ncbi:MAG: hypothetical protein ACMG6E_03520, partial [Candidatus Roizmanbacteria bacterium]